MTDAFERVVTETVCFFPLPNDLCARCTVTNRGIGVLVDVAVGVAVAVGIGVLVTEGCGVVVLVGVLVDGT